MILLRLKLIFTYRWPHNFGLFWPTWTPNSREFSATLSQASKPWTRLPTLEATEDVRKRLLWSPTVVSTKAEKAEKGFKTIYYTCYANSRECYGGFIQKIAKTTNKTKRRHTTMIFLFFFFFFSQKKSLLFSQEPAGPPYTLMSKVNFCPKIEILIFKDFFF